MLLKVLNNIKGLSDNFQICHSKHEAMDFDQRLFLCIPINAFLSRPEVWRLLIENKQTIFKLQSSSISFCQTLE